MTLRILATVSAGLTALNIFLLSYPGDLVPQAALLVVGAASATAAAMVAMLAKPST